MWLKALPYIAAVLILVAAGAVGYVEGKSRCEVKDARADLKAIEKGNQAHDKIEEKVLVLSDPDLDRRISKWVRGPN